VAKARTPDLGHGHESRAGRVVGRHRNARRVPARAHAGANSRSPARRNATASRHARGELHCGPRAGLRPGCTLEGASFDDRRPGLGRDRARAHEVPDGSSPRMSTLSWMLLLALGAPIGQSVLAQDPPPKEQPAGGAQKPRLEAWPILKGEAQKVAETDVERVR